METKKNTSYNNYSSIIGIITLACLLIATSASGNSQLSINWQDAITFLVLAIIVYYSIYFLSHCTATLSISTNNSSIHVNDLKNYFDSYDNTSVKSLRKRIPKNQPKEVNTKATIPYVDEVFSDFDPDFIKQAPLQTISILSYFATSLFGKNNVDDVLWDIVENCIAHLHLEDCVIYMLDKDKKYLIQKAAFGNKNNGQKKIVSPIKIKVGEGIVGHALKTGTYQRVQDVTINSSYIIDDAVRKSELCVPIYIRDTVIGVLDSEHSNKNFYTDQHVFLFHLIAKLTEKKLMHICANNNTFSLTGDNTYFKELEFLMKEAKLYRDSNLGLSSLASKLSISGNYLSQLVNQLTGKNFTDYINTFRVEDAKSKLTNENYINYTIVGIGLESGFNSKSTFYSAFKKIVGKSPSSFRKDHQSVRIL